jgi:hypothetical protein
VADASYFVTIRLAGTLPRAVVEALREEREAAGMTNGLASIWRESSL